MRIARPAAEPIATGGFGRRMFEAFCLFIVAVCCVVVAWSQARSADLAGLESGAVILSVTTEYDEWPALALLDNDPHTGWASRRGHARGNEIVIELAHLFELESIVFDSTRAQEIDFPGVSAREIEVWLATREGDGAFELAAVLEATQGGRELFPLPTGSRARWIKLVINSNWGNEEFTELMEIEAYGSPVGSLPGPSAISGTWLTNFGPLYLEQSGELVRGCYDGGGSMVTGRVDGRMMRLAWREAGGAGSALLTVSASGDYLNGLWYEGAELRGTWRGPRDHTDPQPPCEIEQVAWASE